jgi:hypothetical protein
MWISCRLPTRKYLTRYFEEWTELALENLAYIVRECKWILKAPVKGISSTLGRASNLLAQFEAWHLFKVEPSKRFANCRKAPWINIIMHVYATASKGFFDVITWLVQSLPSSHWGPRHEFWACWNLIGADDQILPIRVCISLFES